VVRERSGLTNQFLHPPTAGDSLELEMKYFPIKLSTDFFTCPLIYTSPECCIATYS